MVTRRIIASLLVAVCQATVATQVFYDSLGGESVGSFPSQWDLQGGLAMVAETAQDRIIAFPQSGGTIFPLVAGEDDNYLADSFTLEFDVFFDQTSSLYGQRLYLRLWPGGSGFTEGDIRYKPFVLYRDGLDANWNNPAAGTARNHLAALQTLEPVWRHVVVERRNGSLRVTMDDQLVFFLPRFKMQPTMVSIGGAINDSQFPAKMGFTKFSIRNGAASDSGVAMGGTSGTDGASDAAVADTRPTGPTVSTIPGVSSLPSGGGIAGTVPAVGGGGGDDNSAGGSRPEGPVARTVDEADPDLSNNALSRAIAEDDSLGKEPSTSSNDVAPSQPEVPELTYSAEVLVYSGITGGEGDYTQRVVFKDAQHFPYWIETRENYDKPCTVFVHSAPGSAWQGEESPAGGKVTEYDVCSEGLPRINPLTTLARMISKPEAGTFKPVTAIQVCNNGINNRVKGIRAQVRKARFPAGNWDPSYDTVTFQEMMNCVNWKPLVSCPANTYAVGVILHFRDGDLASPRDFLSGLELNCSEASWN